MKLLWLDINCSYAHASLALPAIHAQCGDLQEVEWEVLSGTVSTPLGALVEQVAGKSPDIIAATCWLFTHEYLLKAIGRIKALLPGCTVILGGPEYLGHNETYLRSNASIDAVFRGEGEEAFGRWLKVAGDRDEWGMIEGLCYIDRDGRYIDNGLARVMDLASLHTPESSRFFNWSKPFVQLETTRGCFNSCTFCVSGAEKPVRRIPLDAVRERIENIRLRGIREIRLLDRTFNGNIPKAMELLRLFAEYPDMRFHLEIHPALLPDEMREYIGILPAGLLHLEAGIQSLREPVLRACKRHGELSDALDGLRFLCGLENAVAHVDLIVGLPLYTLDELVEDIHTLVSFGAEEIQVELLKVLPGTEMRRNAAQWGIVYSPSVPYEVLATGSMNVGDIQTGRLVSRLLDMYYNTRAWQQATATLMMADAGFLLAFLAWMRRGEQLEQPLSIEKRGLLLFAFCHEYYPASIPSLKKTWEKAQLSVRKIQHFL